MMAGLTWPKAVAALALLGGAGAWLARYESEHAAQHVVYRTAPVARRDLTGRVTASGTLSALVTVQVGTQVSGRIQKLGADFNSPVRRGQVVAKIDPQLFEAAVQQAQANYRQAQASLASAEASAANAERQQARTKTLREQSLAAQSDLDTADASVATTRAAVEGAKAVIQQMAAQLHQAEVNLSYTNIVSPIDGVVISRSVDVGQTVAASLQTPTLFTIAQDLTKMQVDTSVAEGDIGRLRVGMKTYFTVDAYPGRRFEGSIRQIRNAATTVQNVVTYDAVIDVENADLSLRPGMTANVAVVYAESSQALVVPTAALRFHPADVPPPPSGGDQEVAWALRDGQLAPAVVRPGLTDSAFTELVEGTLHEGDQVVVETLGATGPASSPPKFGPPPPGGPPGGGMGPPGGGMFAGPPP